MSIKIRILGSDTVYFTKEIEIGENGVLSFLSEEHDDDAPIRYYFSPAVAWIAEE